MSLASLSQSIIRNHFFFYLFFSGIFFFTQVLISERDSLDNFPPDLENVSLFLKDLPLPKPPMSLLLKMRTYCVYIYCASAFFLTFFKLLVFLNILKRPSYSKHSIFIRLIIKFHFFSLSLCAIYLFLTEKKEYQRPVVRFLVQQGYRPPPPHLLFSLQYLVIGFIFIDTLFLTLVKFMVFASSDEGKYAVKKGRKKGGKKGEEEGGKGKEGEVVEKVGEKKSQVRRRKKNSAQWRGFASAIPLL